MIEVSHPEVLARDWLPPVVLGREREVAEIARQLDPPRPHAPPPWVAGVVGPAGSGTSAVARRAARVVADRLRAEGTGAPPRVISVRTAGLRGTHGVASALLRHLDDGFDGRGFTVTEVLAGFLRRVRRDGRPTVLVLDDLYVGGPDLGPVLRALANPDRFLPEGEFGMPPCWTILAGTAEAWSTATASAGDRISPGAPVTLLPYSDRALAAVVQDRAERALGHPPQPDLVARAVEQAIADGGGARRALELLRRGLVGGPSPEGDRGVPWGGRLAIVEIEPRVVRAIESVSHNREARVGDVRRCEADLALAQGARPLPATTLWRRIVRLERAGYLRREIRPGGEGGTRSVVRVLMPIDEWVTATRRPETRPIAGSWTEHPMAASEPARPSEEPMGSLRPPSDPAD